MQINGVLLLYHLPLTQDAPTILENIRAYESNSRFKVWNVNTYFGFPASLAGMRFSAIGFHYSLFGNWPFALNEDFLSYVDQSQSSYKVALFQDEYQYCRPRFDFLNRCQVDCVYTLIEPQYFKDVYEKFTSVPRIIHYLTGYVSDEMIDLAHRLTIPDEKRSLDIGYRARSLPYYMGRGAQEKTEVAVEFKRRAAGLGLKLDIETDEQRRIYGAGWYDFVANCRGMIGTEAGVSITDLTGEVRADCERLLALNPQFTFAEMSKAFLHKWEDFIPQRVISPRHFEAAAFRVCQILYEGRYSGAMKPMVHYIPLRKDFSNFDECIRLFQQKSVRDEITGNAYNDLIASGRYSYQSFILGFDEVLGDAGLEPLPNSGDADAALRQMSRELRWLELRSKKNKFIYSDFPGRRPLAALGGPLLRALRRLKGRVA
ncbi:MAG TPA: hypothetical protein VHQ95_10410 [Pyrinomonadaceae bacterium]|nr:hypothetical protein [Pyrinomonadaceae bacterium]